MLGLIRYASFKTADKTLRSSVHRCAMCVPRRFAPCLPLMLMMVAVDALWLERLQILRQSDCIVWDQTQ